MRGTGPAGGHYDLDGGQLRRAQILLDEPSPPSALYEALHPSAPRPGGTMPFS